MFGTDAERATGRLKIDALSVFFGSPTIFFTLNQASYHNLSLQAFCGLDIDVRENNFDWFIASHPFSAAEWYLYSLKKIIEHILGWNNDLKRPRRGGGVFGTCQAFFFGIEEQRRGALHSHGLLWSAGAPPTTDQLHNLLETDPEFTESIRAFAAEVLVEELCLKWDDCVCGHRKPDGTECTSKSFESLTGNMQRPSKPL